MVRTNTPMASGGEKAPLLQDSSASSMRKGPSSLVATGMCCCTAVAAALVAAFIFVEVAARRGVPVPQLRAPHTSVGLRASVQNTQEFIRKMNNDPQAAKSLKQALAKASGLDEASIGSPVLRAEPATETGTAGDVEIEFDVPAEMPSKHAPVGVAAMREAQSRSAVSGTEKAVQEHLGPDAHWAAAIKAAFPTEVKSAKAALETEVSARCTLNLHVEGVSFCGGLLATAVGAEQERIRQEALKHLPGWAAGMTVGYAAGSLIVQPTAKIANQKDRLAFGSDPAHRLGCTFQAILGASPAMRVAEQKFAEFSGGKCRMAVGLPQCTSTGAQVEKQTCASADVLPPAHR
eukprot:gnl/TRDRNA2_/TRDRNA2_193246_c0_seq1.p1 gnl/TRDRNA2_/TRDRNA2_193246_c0~~gnl/TRDRNA2_/TRDRNA2_193246_c0_seq1.p1  ORF type:complete len:348 (-),score=83.52 gnl/TRDRNA2_/TRDRNA2_193246_c0_seq1:103-1146(-)